MIQTKAKVIKNIAVAPKYYKIALSCSPIAKDANAGQFVAIKITDSYEAFLRRPFSIHKLSGPGIEILYEIVGKGTEILSQKKAGEYLDIIGPLGNGFDLGVNTNDRTPILVAGGIGVAPLIFLAEKLAEIPNPKSQIPNLVLIGAKTRSGVLCEKEFIKLGCNVKIATDDGSRGYKGYVTGLLKKELSTINYQLSTIYACGPRPMLKETAAISKKYNIPAQVSLEEHMACGIGACLGCAVNTKQGYKRVCQDGPVFDADEIVW
jgi:dihydroorotate dehydrogenase electron transfer subunit